MMNHPLVIQALKLSLMVFWLVLLISLFIPFPEGTQLRLEQVGVILAAVHLLEFALQRQRLEAIQAGGMGGFIQTMLFGFVYWHPLLKAHRNG